MKNFKLILAYEGTHYLGWQKTETGPSIEAELERVLQQILQHPIRLQAASRTDAGVHAEGQVVNFFSDTKLPLNRLQTSCNSLLPEDIRVLHLEKMPPSFHPTLHATGKEYHYFVCLGATQLPFHRKFSWHFFKPVDIDLMRKAALFLIGKHDFSALTNEPKDDNIREIYRIEIEEIRECFQKILPPGLCQSLGFEIIGKGDSIHSIQSPLSMSQLRELSHQSERQNLLETLPNPQRIRICVAGNHFLYKMVRNIVGTLLYVGCGMISLEEVPSLLKNKDRKAAGMTAPAHGLSLKCVFYD